MAFDQMGMAGAGMNKDLLLYMLLGAGAGLSQEPWTQNVAQAGQGYLGAKSQYELIKQMLGGEVPDGGKVTFDKDGAKLSIPKTHLGKMLEGEKETSAVFSPRSDSAETKNFLSQPMDFTSGGTLNPSVGRQGSAMPSLVGLTPQNVSQAFAGALQAKQFEQQKYNDVINNIYKRALTGQAMANTQKLLQPNPLDRNYPIPHPTAGAMSLREWEKLPQDEREYASYVYTAKKLGDSDIMSRREFDMLDPTDKEKFLRAAMADPELMAAARALARSGATRISLGEKLEYVEKAGEIRQKQWFTDPKGRAAAFDKFVNSEEVQNQLFMADPADRARMKSLLAEKWHEEMIKASKGKIISKKLEGRDFVWVVKWPDGKTSEVRYAN